MTSPSLKTELNVLINQMSLVGKKTNLKIHLIMASCGTKLNAEVNKTGSIGWKQVALNKCTEVLEDALLEGIVACRGALST